MKNDTRNRVELNSKWDSFKGCLARLYGDEAIATLPQRPDKAQLAQPLCSITPATSDQEFAAGASAFLFRKLIPTDTSLSEKLKAAESFIQNVGQEKPVNPVGIEAIDKVIKDWFPIGWDRKYGEFCETVRVSQSACLERSRKDGGARAEAISKSERSKGIFMEQEDFFDCVINGRVRDIPDGREIKILTDDGKFRLVTVASMFQSQLLPLHLTLYDHLQRKCPWLLVGDASPEKFSTLKSQEGSVKLFEGLIYCKGKVFVSGDYEGATNNFNAGHSVHTLSQLKTRASFVPDEIWSLALSSMTGCVFFEYKDKDGTYKTLRGPQTSGQMMGNYLSFPLLCIINCSTIYLAFDRYPGEAREMLKTRVKINGDDIVFQCNEGEEERWFAVVEEAGLVLSRGKTLVHPRYWSINSTFFRSTRRVNKTGIVMIPILRAKTVFPPKRQFNEPPYKHQRRRASGHLDRFNECVKRFQGKKKRIIARFFNAVNRATRVMSFGVKVKRKELTALDKEWRRGYRWYKENKTLYRVRTSRRDRTEIPEELRLRPFMVRQDKKAIATHLSTVFSTAQTWGEIGEDDSWQLMDRIQTYGSNVAIRNPCARGPACKLCLSRKPFSKWLSDFGDRAQKMGIDGVHHVKERSQNEKVVKLPGFLGEEYRVKMKFVNGRGTEINGPP
jgi:hypothetical protein